MNERTRVGYQGEPGSFSEEAVLTLFSSARPVPHRGLRSLFRDVAEGTLAFAVVPVENSQAGSVTEAYDLLAAGGVSIVGEAVVHVDHALLALPGTSRGDLDRVSSHPQALAQCEEYLALLGADVVPVYDTAGAARRELNLSKLESRPLGPEPWRYRFYLDVDAGLGSQDLQDALRDLEQAALFLHVLGSYPRWRDDPPRPGSAPSAPGRLHAEFTP